MFGASMCPPGLRAAGQTSGCPDSIRSNLSPPMGSSTHLHHQTQERPRLGPFLCLAERVSAFRIIADVRPNT